MKKQSMVVAVACLAALVSAAGVASAAVAVKVDVPFTFFVKDKEAQAGQYEITPQGSDMSRLAIRRIQGNGMFIVAVIERLADSGGKEPRIVFDRVEGKHYLSEVHIPGMDGFLVGITKGEETHVVITGKE